jgi:hypothetical protein
VLVVVLASAEILRMRHGLEMIRPDAEGHAAEVVYHEVGGNRGAG